MARLENLNGGTTLIYLRSGCQDLSHKIHIYTMIKCITNMGQYNN